ncbi:transcriptional regulator domain-containing protein [Sphingosinicella soli]|uniref:transcriptional regulator domain-containing protein n=1 Tax=Sphingosinicella soli TaxID=333708 RepID=UPI003C70E7F4
MRFGQTRPRLPRCSSGRRWASSVEAFAVSTLDPPAYEAIALRGRSALAWEVLRRDPAYRGAYSRLLAPRTSVAAGADFVAHWGLHFR